MSYVSPIKIGYAAEPEEGWTDKIGRYIAGEVDNLVLQSCVKVGCHVDKDELEKALRYDRDQYDRGYADGKRDAAPRWHRVEDELPKSGSHVLVCCEVRGINGYRGHYVCDAFHTDAKSIPCSYNDDIDSEYDEETDEYYFPVGWWEVIKNWDDYSCVAISDFVTHWMPLPEPPKEDA